MSTANGISLSSGPGIILAVFGVIVLLASAAAVARTSYLKALIEGLRGDRSDLDIRNKRVESENTELQKDKTALLERINVLENVVTARDEIKHLTDLLTDHDRSSQTRADAIISEIHNAKEPQP